MLVRSIYFFGATEDEARNLGLQLNFLLYYKRKIRNTKLEWG